MLRPKYWQSYAQEPLMASELARLRHSLTRDTPFGEEIWMKRSAARLRLEASLRPRGRPKKQQR